jgi:hypothetical protein
MPFSDGDLGVTSNSEATVMISEEDINRFDPEKQERIRLKIERLVKNGRPRKFLDLWPSGEVTYNSIEHLNALELAAMLGKDEE